MPYKDPEVRKAKNREFKYRRNRTFDGKLAHTYSQMQARVRGQTERWHIYKGLPICSRQEFTAWASQCEVFRMLFQQWKHSGFSLSVSPSIDRIDNSGGYTLENMRWMTQAENSATAGC